MPRFSLWLERYVLSAVFLSYAYAQIGAIRGQLESLPGSPALYTVALPELIKSVLVLLFDAFVGSLLLLSRRPSVPPRNVGDVLVPLVANFFYLAYNLTGVAPEALARNQLPLPWRLPLSFAALHLSLAGFAIGFWAVLHLGRSFGVLVAVRPVVTSGPYRFLRHPIYLGHVLQMAGLLLAHGSLLVTALVAAHLALTLYRARLEEDRLAEHSVLYREYRLRTGFLFPRSGPAFRA